MKKREICAARTRIDAVKVVQVGRETEALNRALDIGLNMRRGICDGAITETIESTLRGDYPVS